MIEASTKRFPQGSCSFTGLNCDNEWVERPNRVEPSKYLDPEANLSLGVFNLLRKNMSDKNIEIMRHSCAHLVAAAVQELHPKAKFGVGPVVENGFYYDIEFPEPIGEEALKQIEEKALEIRKRGEEYVRKEMNIDEAIELFKNSDQKYKVELLKDLKEKGTTNLKEAELKEVTDSVDKVSVYETGNFVDLCRGPHVANTKEIGAFKLTQLAGAYWRGDTSNAQLQRIYGVCFASKEELDNYLTVLEEAKKRDHKKLGRELDLFTFSELVGAGLPLWTPKGTLLRNTVDEYVWELRRAKGYQKVTIPHITKKDLYITSGHWAKFSNDLFKIQTREGHEFAMKPMNCPHHTQIYAHIPRSYRDLPQRYAETTMVYRDEQTGELNGLSRVRCITQDDAHVFCRESQLQEEFYAIWDIIETFYAACGFPKLTIRLSLSDPKHMEKYVGSREDWDRAESQLREFITNRGAEFTEAEGEAAFYGPKIDFMAKDSLGREWQVATIQADRSMPKSFELFCTNEQGEEEQIVMVHAAIMGSIERFLSVLIEHHGGAFPVWLSPVQVQFVPVSGKHVEGSKEIAKEFLDKGIRVAVDEADETVGNKVRKAAKQKVPYVVVVGDKEIAGEEWMIRIRGQEEQEKMSKGEFLSRLWEEIKNKK